MKISSIAATAVSSFLLISSVSGTPVENVRRQQQNGNPELYVTGPRTGGIQPRLPIQELQSRQADQFNMLLLALSAMARVPETNASSYYQIAGIHGRPHIPWNEPSSPSQDTNYGYCTHASALFATWHRPYISLVEQRINYHARQEAARFRGTDAQRWRTAAENLRLPYWDWASGGSAIPGVVMQPTVSVTRANSNGQATRTNIPNPLYQYTFTDNTLKNRYFTGFWRTAQYTLRQPSDVSTSRNNVADQTMRAGYTARRQNTYNLFSIPTFREFSSTAFSPGGTPNSWVSVEAVHNQVHSSIGGTTPGGQGHMSLVDYSSFDPIFWLHHANVDRLAAMYQATHPGQVVTPQAATPVFARRITPGVTQDTIDTPLWPFRKSSGDLFTSRDVSAASSIWDLGYSYPEIPASYRGRSTADLRSFVIGRVNALYSPSAVSQRRKRLENVKRREWLCHFVFTPAEVGAVAELDVYFGNTTLTDGGDDTYVGGGGALGRDTYTDFDKNMKITGVVPLTAALEEQGIDTDNIPAVVKHLADNLKWKMKKGTGSYDLTKLKSLKVGVSSSDVSYGSTQELPKWGNFETYYEITEKKKCGMTNSDSKIVGSKKAPLYLSGDDDEKKDDDKKDDDKKDDDKKDDDKKDDDKKE